MEWNDFSFFSLPLLPLPPPPPLLLRPGRKLQAGAREEILLQLCFHFIIMTRAAAVFDFYLCNK